MPTPIEMEIRHLPPSVRRRCEKELGLPRRDEEHKVFVYGTLLAGESNARCAGRARRQKAWTLGTIYDTGFGVPTFVNRGGTRVVGEVLTVGDECLRIMDRVGGCLRHHRRLRKPVNLVGGGKVLSWLYVMKDLRKDAPVIESGDWVAYRKAGYSNAKREDGKPEE